MLSSLHARSRVIISWSCLLFLVCSNIPQVATAQSPGDDSVIRKLVEEFFGRYQKSDLDGLISLWSEKSPDVITRRHEFQQTFARTKIRLRKLTIGKTDVNKDKATIRVAVEIEAEDIKSGKAADGFGIINRTFHLLREGEVWKVWQYVASEQELATVLLAAKTDEERKGLLAAEKELVTVELVRALLSEGRRLHTQGAYSVALDSYGLALSLAESLRDLSGAANAIRGMANAHFLQGNYKQALEDYQKSLRIYEEIGDKQGIAATLNNIGNVYTSQGAYTPALEHYQKSMKIREEIGDKQGIASTLNNIGLVYFSQGHYTQALEHYQKGLKCAEEVGLKQGIASALTNIGNVRNSQGNYRQALEVYQKSLKIQEAMGDRQGIAATLGNIGLVHYLQGNYRQALERHQRSLKIKKEIGDKQGIANTLGNIGLAHDSQGSYTQALQHYRESLKIKEEIGDKRGIANMSNSIGNVNSSQGNYTQALEWHQRSLKINQEVGDKRGIADTLADIALVHNSRGNSLQALEHHQKSLRIREEIGDKQGIAATLSNIGKAHYSQGHYALAEKAFADAIALVEELRGRVAGDEQQQQQYFQTKLSPYLQMISLLLDGKKHVEAFSYTERVKSRALLDTLQSGRIDVTKAMTDDEQAEERRLKTELVLRNTQIYREHLRKKPDKALLIDLEARRTKARIDYEGFQIDLYAAHPELKIQRGEMQPISIAEAGELIPNGGTAILEYVVTEDNTYLFVLTKEQSRINAESSADVPILNVYTIKEKQKNLADRVRRLHSRLAQKDVEYSEAARRLHDLLVRPARVHLRNKTNLIIVPDGVLWQVPFQTLQPSVNRFLIEDHTISYAPSLTVLREMMNLKQKRQAASAGLSTLLAFGNPDLGPEAKATLRALYTDVLANERLLPLPQTEKLVNTLRQLYGSERSKIYIGAEAREDRVKKEAGSCRILQFATHGIADNTNPMYSRLVMSQSGVDDQEDGMLEAWEIMNLDLNAEMGVLSACETAQGRVAGGEGMIGLAWAFFVAGCPTTIVSQWPVEASSTTELMIEFHKTLKPTMEGRIPPMSKAEALQAAMLKLRKSYRHPFYWAPFVVIGDAR
jgi:CHAT domain-containing protein/Tfp pilus assembly protein PilF